MDNTNETERTRKPFSDKLILYHASPRGTGSALALEPRINRRVGERYNCIFLEMARQKTAPAANGQAGAPATFDWENKITVKLDFGDICEFLAVLEGRQERLGGKRDGLYHESGQANTLIRLQRHETGAGYVVGLSRKSKGSTEEAAKVNLLLSEPEALGLRVVLLGGLFAITFPGLAQAGAVAGVLAQAAPPPTDSARAGAPAKAAA